MKFRDERLKESLNIVEPVWDEYLRKEKDLHEDFTKLLRFHATKTFGCDEKCLDDCLDRTNFINFWEIPVCVRHCKCNMKRIVDLEGGQVNLPHLMHDIRYDENAWKFF